MPSLFFVCIFTCTMAAEHFILVCFPDPLPWCHQETSAGVPTIIPPTLRLAVSLEEGARMGSRGGGEGDGRKGDHVCLTGVFSWMISLLLPRCWLKWIVQAAALRTAASDTHCAKSVCVCHPGIDCECLSLCVGGGYATLKSPKRRLVCLITIKIRYLKLAFSYSDIRAVKTTPGNGSSVRREEIYVCSTVCTCVSSSWDITVLHYTHSPPCCAWPVCCPRNRSCPSESRKGTRPSDGLENQHNMHVRHPKKNIFPIIWATTPVFPCGVEACVLFIQ